MAHMCSLWIDDFSTRHDSAKPSAECLVCLLVIPYSMASDHKRLIPSRGDEPVRNHLDVAMLTKGKITYYTCSNCPSWLRILQQDMKRECLTDSRNLLSPVLEVRCPRCHHCGVQWGLSSSETTLSHSAPEISPSA